MTEVNNAPTVEPKGQVVPDTQVKQSIDTNAETLQARIAQLEADKARVEADAENYKAKADSYKEKSKALEDKQTNIYFENDIRTKYNITADEERELFNVSGTRSIGDAFKNEVMGKALLDSLRSTNQTQEPQKPIVQDITKDPQAPIREAEGSMDDLRVRGMSDGELLQAHKDGLIDGVKYQDRIVQAGVRFLEDQEPKANRFY